MTMMKMMANRGVLLVVLLVAWPAPLCCDAERVECVRAVPDDSGRIGRLVLRLRGGVGKHRGVQTENEFRKEDQVMLNQYAGFNFRKKELLEKLKEKEEEAEGLRSAADEILMAGLDGPEEFQKERSPPMGLDFRWGETFTEWNRDDAQQELDYRLEMNQISQDTINEDIVEIDDKMDTLKTHLKSKFGSQVVLDDESDQDASLSQQDEDADGPGIG